MNAKVNISNTRCTTVSEAVTMPSLIVMASTVSDESLARDTHADKYIIGFERPVNREGYIRVHRQTDRQTDRQTNTHTHTTGQTLASSTLNVFQSRFKNKNEFIKKRSQSEACGQ